ncbi:hypothetical protein [Thiomonas sp.]
MSTRIYQGFLIEANSLPEIQSTVGAFRPYIHRKGIQLLQRFLQNAGMVDNRAKGWRLWADLREKTVQKGIREPSVDTEFRLVFIPDTEQQRCLGIAYTEHYSWFRHWLRQPGVREYRYWNSTDRPSGIPRKTWTRREQDWDRVLGHKAPSMVGFTIDVHDSLGPLPYQLPRPRRRTKSGLAT